MSIIYSLITQLSKVPRVTGLRASVICAESGTAEVSLWGAALEVAGDNTRIVITHPPQVRSLQHSDTMTVGKNHPPLDRKFWHGT